MVAAFMASSGVIFILIQAVATTRFMFPDGVVPGLKSVASASGSPASIILRAGVYGILIKKEQVGSATGIVLVPFNTSISSSVTISRWSTLRASYFTQASIPLIAVNWFT